MIKKNVLIFPAGSEIGIEIFNSLKYNIHFDIFGASGKADHAKFLYKLDRYYEGEYYIEKDNFIEIFNLLLISCNIQFVFPTHDSISLFLIENKEKIKATILTSTYNAALIARDKRMTYEVFKNDSFCPIIYNEITQEIEYPIFLKPNRGQGGKGTLLVSNNEDLNNILNKNREDLVICEYLPGDEISVDCFTDRKRKLLFVGPRSRQRIQMGISFNSESITLNDEIEKIAIAINDKLELRGAWFFQLKKDKFGQYKLLEIAVRQASTMGVYRQLGVNFALLTLFDRMDMDVDVIKNNYSIELDRCLFNRFKIKYDYDHVYLDFDDTLIINNEININAMRYIYYCKNRNISVVLLTKHKYDLDATLEHYGISKSIFKEIIKINIDDDKRLYINSPRAIFIDNYFRDRQLVSESLGIPVFDVDAIDSLIMNE
jgi:hypothetical protein